MTTGAARRTGVVAALAVLMTLALAVFGDGHAWAQAAPSGLAIAPTGNVILINKDLPDGAGGSNRWTIVANVGQNGDILNIAGLIRSGDGTPLNFVNCVTRPDSPCRRVTGDIDPACPVNLQCDIAAPCQDYAVNCPKTWLSVPDASVPLGFFVRDGAQQALATTLAVSPSAASAAPARPADGEDRASTVTTRLENFLTSKPVASERWSVALQIDNDSKRAIATGNVFLTDGSAPKFIYCTSRDGDNVPLFLATGARIPFDCLGTDRCTGDPASCRGDWAPIENVESVPSSFFLPPDGLQPATSINFSSCFFSPPPCVQSPSDPAPGGAGAARVQEDVCAIGDACAVDVSTCGRQSGKLVQRADGRCACEVSIADPECRPCSSAGEPCSIVVQTTDGCAGSSCPREEAAGICQIVSASGRTECVDEFVSPFQKCRGLDGSSCPGGTCCVDDAREGCETTSGDAFCGGLCVPGSSGSSCSAAPCPNGEIDRDQGEECDGDLLDGATCQTLGLGEGELGCSSSCRFDTSGCVGTPTPTPTGTSSPTPTPTRTPTPTPTPSPTAAQRTPTPVPTPTPTRTPTRTPTPTPTRKPTPTPSSTPSTECGNKECENIVESCTSCPGDCGQCCSFAPITERRDNGESFSTTYTIGAVDSFVFEGNPFDTDADRFIVRYGSQVYDSGCIFNQFGTGVFLFEPGVTQVEVEVIGGCANGIGSWSFRISCRG